MPGPKLFRLLLRPFLNEREPIAALLPAVRATVPAFVNVYGKLGVARCTEAVAQVRRLHLL